MGEVIMGVLLLFLALLMGVTFGLNAEQAYQHNQAIAAGVAEYYLDAKNNKQFRYTKTPIHQKAEHE